MLSQGFHRHKPRRDQRHSYARLFSACDPCRDHAQYRRLQLEHRNGRIRIILARGCSYGSVNLAERSWVLAGGGPGLVGLRDTRHRVPLGERSGAEHAVMGSPQQMAPDPEEILHHAVDRGEPLEMSDRREAAHLAFTLSGAFM